MFLLTEGADLAPALDRRLDGLTVRELLGRAGVLELFR
jgi:hypothetical protein